MCAKISRGLRNLNPGNIRRSAVLYKGEIAESSDSAFKQFESIEAGYRAIFVLLHTYRLRGYADDIEGMISRYAPSFENNTERYITFVSRSSGISRKVKLDTLCHDQMVPIVSAISYMENGVSAKIDDVEAGWQLFIADFA